MLERVARFAERPYADKRAAIARRWTRILGGVPFPLRLPWGHWWLVRNDKCGQAVLKGEFERAEVDFVGRCLRPGMTVLDIGAHHGFYTLLAAHKVGPAGRVIAFEPSPRERKFLMRHLRLNRCSNVIVEPYALGSSEAIGTLFVVQGPDTGCNSLRPPNSDVEGLCVGMPVRTCCLDDVLAEKRVQFVDFVKLDAEGAELEILKGAGELLRTVPRPVVLVEVADIRTRPWGYDACEIMAFLAQRGYVWFRAVQDGRLEFIEPGQRGLEVNFVAVPCERLADIRRQCELPAQ